MTLAELVKDSGFARSTVIIHLERLGTEGLLLKEKKPGNDRGRPRSLYRLAGTHTLETAAPPGVVALGVSTLRSACRYVKGGCCKLARNTCAVQGCRLTVKPE